MTPEIRRYRLRHRARPLDVLVAGAGAPLVLLHGWGLSGRAYRPAMLALADLGYQVCAPSLAVADGWSVEGAAEMSAECMAGVDVAPATIVGHSFGGAIGSYVARHHPDFVTALIAVNSPLVPLGNVRLGRIMLPGQHYRVAAHGPAAAALIRAATTRGGLSSLMRQARWFLGSDQARVIEEIVQAGLPRAVIWAKNDSLLPLDLGVRAAEALRCTLHVIDDSNGWPGARPPDHDWPFRHPEHFARTVHGVLDELMKGARR
jgi:pimeloyl-ACP methyl ester carboxylesterase